MAVASPLNGISIWAAFVIGCAAFTTPAPAEMGAKSPSAPVSPPSALPANASAAIGLAEMDPGGTIRLHLRRPTRPASGQMIGPVVPWSPPQERIGYGDIEINRGDPHYDDMLRHLGGLAPGQVKPVPPWRADEQWHCAFDPDRGPCPLEHPLPGRAALMPYRLDQVSGR